MSRIFFMMLLFAPGLASQLTARLANGDRKSGRLELLYNGEWSTVCGLYFNGFGSKEARVACRMLGFNSSGAVAVLSSVYGEGAGRILMDKIKCEGTESSLAMCDHSVFYSHACNHSDDVGVICNEVSPLTARLAGGDGKGGRLEILYNGEWSTVCNSGFGENEATVACRMLGFNSSAVVGVTSNKYKAGTGRIILDGVSCTGTEMSLSECRHKPLYLHGCLHFEDVGVICKEVANPAAAATTTKPKKVSSQTTTTKQVTPLTARLANGDGRSGRLEIFQNGHWRSVCNDGFGDKEARVACRMLGFNGSVGRAVDSHMYGFYGWSFLLDDVKCQGTESSLAECDHNGFYSSDCFPTEAVGVICNEDSPVTARLADGDTEGGRLEIFHNGNWSTVCGNGFGDKEARVACRMLGFNSSTVVAGTSDEYGAGAGTILMDYVRCTGTESSLLECSHSLLYSKTCDHSRDVGVICKEKTSTVTKPASATTIKPGKVTRPTANTTSTQASPTTTAPKQGSSSSTTTSSTATTTEKVTKVTTTMTSRTGNATTVTTLTTTTSTSTTVTIQP